MYTMDVSRVQRFEREAKAASALNHPNIVTIHEIGQHETTHFIVTELVAGTTLRQVMSARQVRISEATEANAEFQKILAHRGWEPTSRLWSLAHLGSARAAALNNDVAQSRRAYEQFFALWGNADADVPLLIEAKKEYEKLK